MKKNNVNLYAILADAFTAMPNVFTSQEFNTKAIELGYPEDKIKHRGLHEYLQKHATNAGEFSKTWQKNGTQTQWPTVSEMITFLKSKGYKIMRPVSEWVEC